MTGVDHLTDADEVVIFYSNNADSVSFDILHKLMFCKSKLSYYKIKRGGKNALDFQLSCYLGYRICMNPEAEFFIISKDNGYDFVLDFWECGYTRTEPNIRRFSNIKTLLQWEAAQRRQKDAALKAVKSLAEESEKSEKVVSGDSPPDAPQEERVKSESGITTEEEEAAREIMSASESTHQFYTAMVKRFRQKRGREIYKHFKSTYEAEFRTKK